MLRSITISKRIIFFACSSFILILLMAFLSYFVSNKLINRSMELGKAQLLNAQYSRVKDIVRSTAAGLSSLVAGLDESEQLRIIRDYVEKTRFEDDASGYFFVYRGTVNAAHPTQKQLVGRDLGATADQNGVYYVRKLREVANAGGGFVSFSFPKPDAGDVPKLGYAETIQGTPFWIGTGVYIDNVEKAESALHAALEELLTQGEMWIGALVLFLLLTGIPFSVFLVASITKPLALVTSEADMIAGGKLDVDIHPIGNDEVTVLENALVKMIVSLREAIHDAEEKKRNADLTALEAQKAREQAEVSSRDAAAKNRALLTVAAKLEKVITVASSSSDNLSSQINQSSAGASEAAQRLSEAATAMNEMNATVQEVARNASTASLSSAETKAKAEAGADIVESSLRRIESVRQVSLELKENMDNLNEYAQNITKIMGVISDIADQTNLLALNAAIEAARAGEAGRGFAVVADEVRKLAEKTMASTNDVSRAVSEIQESTAKSADFVENAVIQIEEATQLAQQSGEALKEIVTTAEATADQVNAIAAASEEQSAASEEINGSILQCNDMSGQISEAMDEATGAVSDLTSEMHELLTLVHELKNA